MAVKLEVVFRVQVCGFFINLYRDQFVTSNTVRIAVIRHGVCFSLYLNNNFLILRDCQRSRFLSDIVVARIELSFNRRVADRVRNAANIRNRSRRLDLRHFTGNKALAASYVRFRQRRAVVGLAGRFRGQRHRTLLDFELAVVRRRNDILFCRVNLENRVFVKRNSVCTGILSRHFRHINVIEAKSYWVSFFDSLAGKAGNAILVSIISLRLAVRRQLDVLIIVEIDLVRSLGDRDRLGFTRPRHRRIALGNSGRYIYFLVIRIGRFALRLGNKLPIIISAPIVVHRVAQIGLLLKLRRERRSLIQRIIPIIFRVQVFLSLCRVKSGVVPRYLISSLVPANEIITGFRRGCHIRQRFACHLAHRLLCDSNKCSVSIRRIGNGNRFTVRLVVHVDDRFPIHSNFFRFIFSYIGITGNLLSSRSDRRCFLTRLTGTCIIVNKLFARPLINIANRIIRFNVFCIYLTIQMPRKRLTLTKRKISCAIL